MQEYIIMHNFDNLPNYKEVFIEVGKVVSTNSKKAVMYILYNKDDYKTANYRIHTSIMENSNGEQHNVVIIGDQYLDIFKNHFKIFQFYVFHELGHFINGDYDNKDFTNKELMAKRNDYIKNGKVLDMELNADRFAVKQIGKNISISAIDYSIMKRKERNDIGADLAIKEMQLRKKAIIKM